MALPAVALPRALVDVGADEKVAVRALTSPEMGDIRRLIDAEDLAESEILIVAYGTDTPVEEARDWYQAVPRFAVQAILDRVEELISSRVEEASKSVAAGTSQG